MTRDEAIAILHEHIGNENLRKHMYAVEAAMRAYAVKYNEDVELWGIAGLLHDFDYEKYPTEEEHGYAGARILEERGAPPEIIQAVLSHTDTTSTPRETLMEKVLYAVDEISGFIVAVTLVRPSKKIEEVKIKSIKKKLKAAAFARQVSREHIEKGIEELGVDRDEHFQFVLDSMKGIAEELGL